MQGLKLDWLIFCLVGRWVCHYCLTLGIIMQYRSGFTAESPPTDGALRLTEQLIPAGEIECLSALSLSHSIIWFSGLTQVEIVGIMTTAHSGSCNILKPPNFEFALCTMCIMALNGFSSWLQNTCEECNSYTVYLIFSLFYNYANTSFLNYYTQENFTRHTYSR